MLKGESLMTPKKKAKPEKSAKKRVEVKDLAPEELGKVSGGLITPRCGDYKPDPNYSLIPKAPLPTDIIKR